MYPLRGPTLVRGHQRQGLRAVNVTLWKLCAGVIFAAQAASKLLPTRKDALQQLAVCDAAAPGLKTATLPNQPVQQRGARALVE